MMTKINQFGQKIGDALGGWTSRPRPPRVILEGRYCRLEPLDPDRHAAELYAANEEAPDDRLWTYLPIGRPASFEAYLAWLSQVSAGEDPLFFTVRDLASGFATGLFSYLRIDPTVGSIEIGHINFSPRLQKTRAATEALYLMAANVFDTLGYRRYEWKCDSLNEPSRAAALRFGFTFEGLFRQATIYKGRTRDTAWFSIIDQEWPALKQAYLAWLAPANFDEAGRQIKRLEALQSPVYP